MARDVGSVAVRISEGAGGVRLAVHVVPRARRSSIEGVHRDALKVRLAAPPVDGAANAALIALMAETFAVPRSAVTIARGAASRSKEVAIAGVSTAGVRAVLGAIL